MNYDPLSLPIGANPEKDSVVSYDDAMQPIYQSSFGTKYQIAMQAPQGRTGAPGSMDRVKSVAGNMLQGLWDGISAPGRAAAGEQVTIGDMLNTAGLVSLGSVGGAAPAGALRSGALRMAESGTAREIADMLSNGRAKDVTDTMMAQADPQEMWRLYAEGKTGADMPMDEASRMARAREMYEDAAKSVRSDGLTPGMRTVYGPEYMTTQSNSWRNGKKTNRTIAGTSATSMADADRAARMHQVSGDNPKGIEGYYPGDTTGVIGGTRLRSGQDIAETILQNPKAYLVRSRDARFDPRLKHLANLSAAGAGGAYIANIEDKKAEIRKYLDGLK